MRICLVSEEFPPDTGWGGIGTHAYTLSKALSALGHDVHVLSASIDGRTHEMKESNITLTRIPDIRGITLGRLISTGERIQKSGMVYDFTRYALKRLLRSIAVSGWLERRQSDFDIIEAAEFGAETFWLQFTRKMKTPIVVKLHTPFYIARRLNQTPQNSIGARLREWMEKYSITHASNLISPTRSLASMVSNDLHINGIDLLANCVDTDYFTCKEKFVGIRDKTVIYAGRIEKRKGVEVLARAIPIVKKDFPDARFIFVGSDTETSEMRGSMRKWLEGYLENEDLLGKVEFKGEVQRTEIVQHYQSADLCVVPSYWENLPYTCLEAMSCGTPVVGSNVGGIAEIIEDGVDGMLFKSGNHVDLAQKIISLLKMDYKQIGMNARNKVLQDYSYKTIAEKTIDKYQHVIETWRKGISSL